MQHNSFATRHFKQCIMALRRAMRNTRFFPRCSFGLALGKGSGLWNIYIYIWHRGGNALSRCAYGVACGASRRVGRVQNAKELRSNRWVCLLILCVSIPNMCFVRTPECAHWLGDGLVLESPAVAGNANVGCIFRYKYVEGIHWLIWKGNLISLYAYYA